MGAAEANPKTVLVMDDDPDLLALLAGILEDEGYRVETAWNGREGLKVVERSMPDLIILDMRMPVMNGWEFARQFRARYGLSVPILVYTASEDPDVVAREIGADRGIDKSANLDTLAALVKHYIRARDSSNPE